MSGCLAPSSIGNTGSKPSTTVPPYPTNTAENVGSAYYFTPSDGNYIEFTQIEAQYAISGFCSHNHVLVAGQVNGPAEGYDARGHTIIAAASWAPDQTGCGTEQDFSFNENSDECLNAWWLDFSPSMAGSSGETSHGGAYVLEPPGGVGCILISLYAFPTSGSKRGLSLRGVDISPDPVVYNSTVEHTNITALRLNATAPAVRFSSDLSQADRKYLFPSDLPSKFPDIGVHKFLKRDVDCDLISDYDTQVIPYAPFTCSMFPFQFNHILTAASLVVSRQCLFKTGPRYLPVLHQWTFLRGTGIR